MTNTPKTDPDSLWPRHDLRPHRPYAPGIREEKVVCFGLPPAVSRTFDAGRTKANAEFLLEELQIECKTLWQTSALVFATVQRIADDQAEIVARVLGSLRRAPLARADPAEAELPSPVFPPDAMPIVTDGIIRSFGEIVAVTGESYRELLDIQTGRLLTRVSILWTISGWSEPTDANRNNEG